GAAIPNKPGLLEIPTRRHAVVAEPGPGQCHLELRFDPKDHVHASKTKAVRLLQNQTNAHPLPFPCRAEVSGRRDKGRGQGEGLLSRFRARRATSQLRKPRSYCCSKTRLRFSFSPS